jgi:hypothetical protein
VRGQHPIGFADGARREISIFDVDALAAFVGNEATCGGRAALQ